MAAPKDLSDGETLSVRPIPHEWATLLCEALVEIAECTQAVAKANGDAEAVAFVRERLTAWSNILRCFTPQDGHKAPPDHAPG